MAAPVGESAADATSPPASQPSVVVVTSIDPVIQLPQLEEIFSAIGQLSSLRWFDAVASRERVCLLEYADEAQASSALIISDMHIMLGSKEIAVRKWDSWWQQQQEELARQKEQQQQAAAAAAAQAAAAATAMPATLPGTQSTPLDPSGYAAAAIAAAQLAQSLSNQPSSSAYPAASAFDPNLSTIYVGNLAPPVTEEILTAYFSQVGPLAAVRLQADGNSPNRFAFVEFVSVENANSALLLHGQQLLNRPMKVGKASTPITNRALLGVAVPGGAVVLTEAERQARMQMAGNVSGDRVAAALARVAQAQQLIAAKLGVPVSAPAPATLPVLAAGVAPSAAVPPAAAAVERKRSLSRSRSRSRSSDRHLRRRRRSVSHSRSRSPSKSRSRSPSYSRSRSRSPARRQGRVRRWSRERDREKGRGGERRRSRDVSEERRDGRHGRKRLYSRSPSPRPAIRLGGEVEKKEDDTEVGSDRWRAGQDTEKTAEERKDAGKEDDREGQRREGRDAHRDDRRRGRESDRERDRQRSRSRERRAGRSGQRHSPRRGRRRHSSESGEEEFTHRRARDHAGQRNRYKKNVAGKEGLQWDGYQWVPQVQPGVAAGIGK